MDTLYHALHDRIYSLFLHDSSTVNMMSLTIAIGVLKQARIISDSAAEDLLSIFKS